MYRSTDIAFGGVKPKVRDIVSKRIVVVTPQDNATGNVGRITFHIPQSTTEFISSDFVLHAVFTVKLGNGNNLPAGENVAVQNFPVCTLFNNMELQVGSTVVEGLNDTSHIRGVIKAILSLSAAAKNSFAKDLYKWYPDTPGEFQNSDEAVNAGFAARKLITAGSAYMNLLASLPFDISASGLSFPTGTELKVALQHRPNSERIQSDTVNANYRLQFQKCELLVTYLTLNQGSLLSIRHRLSQAPLYYQYLRTGIVGPMSIAAGMSDSTLTVARGIVPELILVGIQPVTYSGGDYAVNSQDFSPNACTFMQANVNGVFFPSTPYTPDFNNIQNCNEIFANFVEVCRSMCLEGDNVIDFTTWSGGSCLFPIQLRSHLPSPFWANEPMSGDLFLRLKFAAPLPAALNVYVFTVSSARLGIDVNRSITVDSTLAS